MNLQAKPFPGRARKSTIAVLTISSCVSIYIYEVTEYPSSLRCVGKQVDSAELGVVFYLIILQPCLNPPSLDGTMTKVGSNRKRVIFEETTASQVAQKHFFPV